MDANAKSRPGVRICCFSVLLESFINVTQPKNKTAHNTKLQNKNKKIKNDYNN